MSRRTKLVHVILLCVVFISAALLTGGCETRSASNNGKSIPSAEKSVTKNNKEVGTDWVLLGDKKKVFGGTGNQEITDVVAGGPGLVAVGRDRGKKQLIIWTSKDAVNWTRVAPENFEGGQDLDHVADNDYSGAKPAIGKGPSGLVVASHLDLWVSPDGLKWRKLLRNEAAFDDKVKKVFSVVSLSMWDVVGNDRIFVAVGNSGYWRAYDTGGTEASQWFSIDGTNWQRVPRNKAYFTGGTGKLTAVAYDGTRFVAVGEVVREGFGTDAAVWTSPDGKTWAPLSQNDNTLGDKLWQKMFDVASGPKGFVAIGGESTGTLETLSIDIVRGAVWISPDGGKWTRIPHNDELFGGNKSKCYMEKVISGATGYVIFGEEEINYRTSDVVWLSKDGMTWTKHPLKEVDADAGDRINSVASFHSGLVAVGSSRSDAAVWVSGNLAR